jgi:signal transduction histidine kinase
MNIITTPSKPSPTAAKSITTRQEGDWVSDQHSRHRTSAFPSRFATAFSIRSSPPRNRPGTGMGLSLSFGLISKLGGSIECQSAVGHGAEFIIKFPCVAEAPQNEEGDLVATGPITERTF